jgi:hypothetical protein
MVPSTFSLVRESPAQIIRGTELNQIGRLLN